MKAAKLANPSDRARTKSASTEIRNQERLRSYLNLALARLLIFPRSHDMMSCITPSGHSMEQYTRPKIKVAKIRHTNTTKFAERTAGMNCIFASHPHPWIAVAEKSTKRAVIAKKQITAKITLIFLSIECDDIYEVFYKIYANIVNKIFILVELSFSNISCHI